MWNFNLDVKSFCLTLTNETLTESLERFSTVITPQQIERACMIWIPKSAGIDESRKIKFSFCSPTIKLNLCESDRDEFEEEFEYIGLEWEGGLKTSSQTGTKRGKSNWIVFKSSGISWK
jgi:hypothetical protein